uniref:uncharacterized protein LOC120329597 n=1 Tax=Styela clava TaxID=7725 RepID=UPI001939D571|nr:uncharacterized protein LOC120329597 [Styela clava]
MDTREPINMLIAGENNINQTLGSDTESSPCTQESYNDSFQKASDFLSKIYSSHDAEFSEQNPVNDVFEFANVQSKMRLLSNENQTPGHISDNFTIEHLISTTLNERKRFLSHNEHYCDSPIPKRSYMEISTNNVDESVYISENNVWTNTNGIVSYENTCSDYYENNPTSDQAKVFSSLSNMNESPHTAEENNFKSTSPDKIFCTLNHSVDNAHTDFHRLETFGGLYLDSEDMTIPNPHTTETSNINMYGHSDALSIRQPDNSSELFHQYSAGNYNSHNYELDKEDTQFNEQSPTPKFAELQAHLPTVDCYSHQPHPHNSHTQHGPNIYSGIDNIQYDVNGVPTLPNNMGTSYNEDSWNCSNLPVQQPYFVQETNNDSCSNFESNYKTHFNQYCNDANYNTETMPNDMYRFYENSNDYAANLTALSEAHTMMSTNQRTEDEDDDVILVSESPATSQCASQQLHYTSQNIMVGNSHRMKFYNNEHVPAGLPKLKEYSSSIQLELLSHELWQKFHEIGTEMIITKAGRRMFPTLKINITGLHPQRKYIMAVDVLPIDNKRYRYAYTSSQWIAAGNVTSDVPKRTYVHPESPATGETWMKQTVVFDKMKLTNNEGNEKGHIILHSMHKYQPRIHLIECEGNGVRECETVILTQSVDTSQENVITFVFAETQFTTVTAYQNQQITKLKIDKNPFAKGFRDTSRSCKAQDTDKASGITQSCSLFRQPPPPVVTIGPNHDFTNGTRNFQLENVNQTQPMQAQYQAMAHFRPTSTMEQLQQNEMSGLVNWAL